MARKREDSATVGDLEDLADAIRGGFKDALGNVIPAPTPKPEGDPADPPKPEGDPADPPKSDWGFKGRWWGGS
jgi:hypothetical protein